MDDTLLLPQGVASAILDKWIDLECCELSIGALRVGRRLPFGALEDS
jgi:hypothetical protein